MVRQPSVPLTRPRVRRRAFLGASAAVALGALAVSACGGTVAGSTGAALPATSSGARSGLPATSTAASTSAPAVSGSAAVPAAGSATTAAAHITWSNPSGDPTDIAIVQKFFQGFQQQYPSIKVDVQNVPSQFPQKLEAAMAGGVAPDIFWMDTLTLGSFAAKGALLPIDSFISRDHFDTRQLYPVLLPGYVYQGKRYALPKDNGSSYLAWNVDAFKEASVPAPAADWTWQEFLDAARKLTKRSATAVTRYGFNLPKGFSHIAPWVWQHGGDYFDPQYTKSRLGETPAVEALQYLSDLANKEQLTPTADVIKAQGYAALFERGTVAMQQYWPGQIPELRLNAKSFTWDVAPLPRDVNKATFVNGAGNAVWSASRSAETCWVLIQYFESKVGQDFFLASGKGVPSNTAVGAEYTDQKPPPTSLHVMIDDLSFGRSLVGPPTWTDISAMIDRALAPLWTGSQSAKQATDSLVPQINAILAASH